MRVNKKELEQTNSKLIDALEKKDERIFKLNEELRSLKQKLDMTLKILQYDK